MYSKLIKTLIAVSLLFSGLAHAEIKQTLGNWDVHYIAIPTSVLQPNIARQYGIKRSKYNGFVNISVLDVDTQKAVPQVWLTGKATNLLGQSKQLTFNKIKEQDSIYHIAQLSIDNEEIWRFEILVNHPQQQQKLKFEQKFYVD